MTAYSVRAGRGQAVPRHDHFRRVARDDDPRVLELLAVRVEDRLPVAGGGEGGPGVKDGLPRVGRATDSSADARSRSSAEAAPVRPSRSDPLHRRVGELLVGRGPQHRRQVATSKSCAGQLLQAQPGQLQLQRPLRLGTASW